MYFQEILGLVRQKIVDKLFIQTDQNLPKNVFLPTTDKYSSVYTEYSVAEYSVGHYSADRIVGRSLMPINQHPYDFLYELAYDLVYLSLWEGKNDKTLPRIGRQK
jgi:hypothetical protein